jgi:hypothetical protein
VTSHARPEQRAEEGGTDHDIGENAPRHPLAERRIHLFVKPMAGANGPTTSHGFWLGF